MRILKYIPFFALLALSFSSCADEITNDYYIYPEGNFNVNILSDKCLCLTIHKRFFDSSYVSDTQYDSRNYTHGIELKFALDRPAERNKVKRLKMTTYKTGFEFNEEELRNAYIDSLNEYDLGILKLDYANIYSQIWNVELYNESNEASNVYPVVANYDFLEAVYSSESIWLDTLYIYFNSSSPEDKRCLHAGAVAEVHLLNSEGKERGVYRAPLDFSEMYFIPSIRIPNPPSDATKYYFKLKDEYNKGKRGFVSNIKNIMASY